MSDDPRVAAGELNQMGILDLDLDRELRERDRRAGWQLAALVTVSALATIIVGAAILAR